MEGLEELATGEVETKVEGGELEAKVETIEKTPEQIKAEEAETKRQSDFKALRKHNKEIEQSLKAEREARIKAEARAEALAEVRASRRNIEPKLADFGGDAEAYAEAKTAYLLSKAKHSETETLTKQQQEQRAQQEQMASIDEEFKEQITIRMDIDPDLKTALDNINKSGIGDNLDSRIGNAIKSSPVGVEIVKFLGLNPEFTSQLEDLPLSQQAVRLRVLEKEALRVGSLDHLSKSKTQKTEVPPKVNAEGSRSIKPTLTGAQSIDDFAKAFRAQLKG